jgi:orotate phosphoribosyltransferase
MVVINFSHWGANLNKLFTFAQVLKLEFTPLRKFMVTDRQIAEKVASFLLQIKAVKLNPLQPYTWASGWKSPIYCDNRISLSFPVVRTFIRQELSKLIVEKYGKPDVIAGVATGAIAQGALVAEELGLPFIYIRPNPKQHGLGNQIEGQVEAGQKVVVVEDLVSTGQSSLNAAKVLTDFGCNVVGMVAIFSYGFLVAEENFKQANCNLHTLCDYTTLIHIALESGIITNDQLPLLENWRRTPQTWIQ